jgi:chemotaxis-related protein WspB
VLYLLFTAGARRYALAAGSVVEVVPLLRLDPLPGAPPSVRGLFSYRGIPVAAVDVSVLSGGGEAPERMSTRIVIVSYSEAGGAIRLVGLLATSVTETVARSGKHEAPSRLNLPDAPWIESAFVVGDEVVPCVRVEAFLPVEIRALVDARSERPG